MAAKVFESISKSGLALAVAGGVVNSALYNVDAGHTAVIFDRFHGYQTFKDLQNVHITLCILFWPIAGQLPCIFTSIEEDYDEHVLLSITTKILKSAVAHCDAGELITQRTDLQADDVSLIHLTFGKEFTEVVEAKQEAERAKFVVEKAEQQKKAVSISAEGDSKAAELIPNKLATVGDGLIELHKLEAAEDIITYQFS
ncbi:Prohibitin, partial [Plecturocebus cupreus]